MEGNTILNKWNWEDKGTEMRCVTVKEERNRLKVLKVRYVDEGKAQNSLSILESQ